MNTEEKQYVKSLEDKVKYYEDVFESISSPIIPSVIPETILVPLAGRLTRKRFENIITKVLTHVQRTESNAAIIDFTGISTEEVDFIGYEELSQQIHRLAQAMELMGVEVLFSGFSSELAQTLVAMDSHIQLSAHASFRTALQYLMDKKELRFSTVNK